MVNPKLAGFLKEVDLERLKVQHFGGIGTLVPRLWKKTACAGKTHTFLAPKTMQLCHPLLNIDLKGDTIRISQTFKKCFEEKTKLLSSQCLSIKSFMQEKGTK